MGDNVVNFPQKRRRHSTVACWGLYLLFSAVVGTVVMASWLLEAMKAVLP